MKRMICILLCICLLVVPVSAESESAQLQQTMADHYYEILKYTNMRSLSGWCGLMASWQLYLLGINQMVVSYHGCNQFDAYREMTITSGGHRVEALDARDYDLLTALETLTQGGRQNVYNILVGFDRTNTDLGSIYGHSMVIYAILGGTVYFTESYATPFAPAGTPIQLSMEEFAAYYTGRGEYEGLIHFGKKGYVANCQRYSTNVYLTVTEGTCLWQEPRAEGEPLRAVARGERLWATALYRNPDGQYFYQIEERETAGYILADRTALFQFQYEDVDLSNGIYPRAVALGEDPEITGRISADFSAIGSVRMTVTDGAGKAVLDHAMAKQSGVYDLENDIFSDLVDFGTLPEGSYLYSLYAQGENAWFDGGEVAFDSRELLLTQKVFTVGQPDERMELPESIQETPDGWMLEENGWHCYENGKPRTGWYCYEGGDYYFDPGGAAVTGWQAINGHRRYFSATGSMRTGWLDTPQGTLYLLFNGVPATGTRTIDGMEYTFDGYGYLIK